MGDSLASKKFVDGIYIPAGLLVIGTVIVKREWTPYAVLLALALGVYKYFNSCMFPLLAPPLPCFLLPCAPCVCIRSVYLARVPLTRSTVPKKVLKPDEYQEFPLKEKTIISHNVAMYAKSSVLLPLCPKSGCAPWNAC